MLRKIILSLGLAAIIITVLSKTANAQAPSVTFQYYLARVVAVLEEEIVNDSPQQLVEIEILNGPDSRQRRQMEVGGFIGITREQRVQVGETLVVTQDEGRYFLVDKFRIPALITIFVFFFVLVLIFGGIKGVGSIFGLFVSLLVLIYFIIPRIVSGQNPLMISLLGAVIIATTSIYLAHGYSKRTTIALLATLITLSFAAIASYIFVYFSKLSGTGSEEALFLQGGLLKNVNLRGLLLGGIIIGSLGVLDDVTTAQVATVDELKKANTKLSTTELYKRGLSVGREHIAALVNTLVLAYAGASFPLLLMFTLSSEVPVWISLNTEFIAEEIVRTLVGSSALIIAVPISTFLAAYYFAGIKRKS